ncbi:MAG: MurT ligase domain-containing protein [Coriobacteriales bacterium]|nr:MurT ligase domain-containing protein [Coriobacteriales bacterium]
MALNTKIAIAVTKFTNRGMRIVGKNGRSLPGKIGLKFDKNLIRNLSSGTSTILITGTNGKTTTTHIITQAILNEFGACAYDPTSTNMSQGIATTLCLDAKVSGKRKSTFNVIECDEGATIRVVPQIKPDIILVTNLFKDQVDRYDSITKARDYIIDAIKSSPDSICILNADDQIVASIADFVDNRIVWYGVSCDLYSDEFKSIDKQVACVKCDAPLKFNHQTFAHLGNFYCEKCGNKAPAISYNLTSFKPENSLGDFSRFSRLKIKITNESSQSVDFTANISAPYDAYNALAAFCALDVFGLNQKNIISALARFKHAQNRFELFKIEGHSLYLHLIKNAVGANQVISTIASSNSFKNQKLFVVLLGKEIMDGQTTQWINEVDFDKLNSVKTKFILGGPCFDDLQNRLLELGIDKTQMRCIDNYSELLKEIIKCNQDCNVLANCSTNMDFRKLLVGTGELVDFWGQD